MSSAQLPHQDIRGTSATDRSIALAGHFPNLTNVAIGIRESSRPPTPSSTVPFRRDTDFVDRGNLLVRVDERCSQPAGRAALVGLGGVGKSQLAIEYAYRTRERSPDTWVFWVHASNTARFEQGYRDIADMIKIAGRENPKANIIKLVHEWLRGYEGRWLLILDNVDHIDLLSKAGDASQGGQGTGADSEPQQPISAYLPASQNGSILVTSRSQTVALKLLEEKEIVAVEPMAESHALALFEKKLGAMGKGDHVPELAVALEFMPLAIVQAAAYISQRAPRYSVRQYLESFRKSDRQKTNLLDYEGGHLRRDWEAKNSIIITWQISFEHIRQIRPSAADLLSLMSFFDRQGIPEILVRNRAESGNGYGSLEKPDKHDTREEEESDDDKVSKCSENDGFEDDVQTLRNYLFLSIGTDGTFEMHRLVQLATRKWLEANEKLEQWKQSYIKNLSAEFPTGNYENWTYCHILFPHVKSAVTQRPQAEGSLREWASLLYRAAWYAWKKGSIAEAIDLSVVAMKVRKKIVGQEHEETLGSMGMVALAYSLGGRLKDAENLQVQVMETTKRVLGKEHPDTLSSMVNLASTYADQGRWKEAEKLQIQVTETPKRLLDKEHPVILNNIANLASTYLNQGRWKEAEELAVQAMETRKRVLGKEHPDTLATMANLALTYSSQRRWKEAEELEVQTMDIAKRVLGKEHRATLTSMGNLALTYTNQGRWEEAEKLEVQAIEIAKRVLGKEHPDTLNSIANLALIYSNQGRWKEAEEVEIQTIKSMKKVLGEEHPDTLTSMAHLASIYCYQKRWKEAEELDVQTMEIRKKVLGKEHPQTLSSIASLAFLLNSQTRYEEAISLMENCFELQERILGPKHPDTESSLLTLCEWKK